MLYSSIRGGAHMLYSSLGTGLIHAVLFIRGGAHTCCTLPLGAGLAHGS